jgi:hypothetical protein
VDEVRRNCLAQYQSQYGVASPSEAFQGFKLWQDTRALGIISGRMRARAEGLGGMHVYLAPELNIVRALHDGGFQSVLYDVLPSAMFDYVSYSAWESINSPDPISTLGADLATIQEVAHTNAIIIGETGFSRVQWPGQDVALSSAIITSALQWGVAYIVQWDLYDTDAADPFGLYDLHGQPTPLAAWFRDRLQPAISNLPLFFP